MLFNSFTFLFFLPVTFVLYWHLFRHSLRCQNLFVIAAFTFMLVLIGWMIFRADNVSQLTDIVKKLFPSEGFLNLYGSGLRADVFVFIAFMLVVEWLQRNKEHPLQFPSVSLFRFRLVRVGIYYFLIAFIWMAYSSSQEFIYFQF